MVTGVLAQARHLSDPPGSESRSAYDLPPFLVPGQKGKNPTLYTPEVIDLWNSSWAPADITTMRSKGIDRLLERPRNAGGLYGVTKSHPGRKAF